jgi:ectoine hydroxylase-related dioxygenase (phytanoyl-CoA dioxygenase family)
MPSALSTTVIAQFQEQGYHVERGALSTEEVRVLLEALVDVYQTCKDDPRCTKDGQWLAKPVQIIEGTFSDNPHKIWLVSVLEEIRLPFLELIYHPRVSALIDALIGPDTSVVETVAMTKLPGIRSSFRGWHQDTEYFSNWMDERRLVTVLYYLSDMDESSGATAIVAGSHKDPLHIRTDIHPQGQKSNAASSGFGQMQEQERWEDDPRRVILEVQAGDVAFIDSNMIHRAGGNDSDTCRHNIIYTYANSELRGVDMSKKGAVFNVFPATRNGQPARDTADYKRLRQLFQNQETPHARKT